MDKEHKVLLTGTPLQNNVEELYNLLSFLQPQRFYSEAAFMEEFGNLKTESQVEKLQQVSVLRFEFGVTVSFSGCLPTADR